MIYDCFTFLNELDLLEVRLNTLYKKVDFFVLVEADKDFIGRSKPLYFKENKKRFKAFKSKIIHVEIKDLSSKNAWQREYFQRNAIMRGLKRCKPNDLVIISDIDEIPNPEILKTKLDFSVLEQNLYYYKFNCQNITQPWRRSVILKFNRLDSPQAARDIAINLHENPRIPVVPNAGWHFSYLGSSQNIKQKIQSIAHQEFNQSKYTDPEGISQKVSSASDLFNRPEFIFRFVELDNSFPAFIRKNKEKYSKYIHPLTSQEKELLVKEKPLFDYLYRINQQVIDLSRNNHELIREKKETVAKLKKTARKKEQEISNIKKTLRWRIPNLLYKTFFQAPKPKPKPNKINQ
ncbi:MAG: hypothetical protein ABIC19_03620 [Patescibacteria group bacterium]|nr:hypothetical protein [Patescibacteria group bacterium]